MKSGLFFGGFYFFKVSVFHDQPTMNVDSDEDLDGFGSDEPGGGEGGDERGGGGGERGVNTGKRRFESRQRDNDDDNDNNDDDESDGFEPYRTPEEGAARADDDDDDDVAAPAAKRAVKRDNLVRTMIPSLPEQPLRRMSIPFELLPEAALRSLVKNLSWSEYMAMAATTNIALQRFLGLDAVRTGIDAGQTIKDNLFYPQGIRDMLTRDYGIAYAPRECGAQRPFERQMVSEALARYAPFASINNPATGTLVTRREQLIKLRRLYTWLAKMGTDFNQMINNASFTFSNTLSIVEFLGHGLVVVALYNRRQSRPENYIYITMIELFQLYIDEIHIDDLFTRPAYPLPAKYYSPLRPGRIVSDIAWRFRDDGQQRDLDPQFDTDNRDAFATASVDGTLYITDWSDDAGGIVWSDDNGGVSRRVGDDNDSDDNNGSVTRLKPLFIVDITTYNSAKIYLWGPLIAQFVDEPVNLRDRTVFVASRDPAIPSMIVAFPRISDSVNEELHQIRFFDKDRQPCWRLVAIRVNHTEMWLQSRADIPSSNSTRRPVSIVNFAVMDFDSRGRFSEIRQYRWTATSVENDRFGPRVFGVTQNGILYKQFLMTFNNITYQPVFDPETGQMAFYTPSSLAVHGETKIPLLPNNLANALPLPSSWATRFVGTYANADGSAIGPVADDRGNELMHINRNAVIGYALIGSASYQSVIALGRQQNMTPDYIVTKTTIQLPPSTAAQVSEVVARFETQNYDRLPHLLPLSDDNAE